MPVFYFDVQDSEGATLDTEGCDFGSLDEARDEAVRFLPDLARAVFPLGGGCELIVRIREREGPYLYEVALSLVAERVQPPGNRTAVTDSQKTRASSGSKVIAHPVAAADAAVGRLAARLSTQYFLRMSQSVSSHAGGELVTGLVLRAVTVGNSAYLDQDPETFGQFASVDDLPPDDVRRPVSVSAVAASLGVSYETARRHVSKLVTAGLCIRVRGGVVAPSANMQGPWEHQAMLANMASLRRLYRALKRAGVDFD
jgi:hypothetical protein